MRRSRQSSAAAIRAANPRPRSSRRPHLRSAALVGAGAACAVFAFLATNHSLEDTKRELLAERATEVNTTMGVLVDQYSSSLESVAQQAGGGDVAGFQSAAKIATKSLAGVALVRVDGPSATVVSQSGLLHGVLPQPGSSLPPVFTRALASTGLQFGDFVGQGGARALGMAFGVSGTAPRYVVYGELPIPEDTTLSGEGGAFGDIHFAVYLGTAETHAQLLFSDVPDWASTGDRAMLLIASTGAAAPQVSAGPYAGSAPAGSLLLVVTPAGNLVGGFASALPWVTSISTLLMALLFGAVLEIALRRRDGALAFASELKDKNAQLDAALARQEESARALAERERSFRNLFDDHPNPMWACDIATGQFLAVNEAAVEKYGYSRGEFLAMRIGDVQVSGENDALRIAGGRRVHGERGSAVFHKLKDGRVIHVEITAHDQEFAGHRAALMLAQDITERTALEDQLRHQAFHDTLTGLANRALFNNRVEHAIARTERGRPCAVLLLDLDNFKTINDSLGHTTGDALLVEVADRLRTSLRPTDTAARLGGDEFAILVEDVTDAADAAVVAERLLADVQRSYEIDGRTMFTSVSVGIALADGEVITGDDLVRNADLAMYCAKSEGRGRVEMYQPEMHVAMLDRMAVEHALRGALAEGRLRVAYQPRLDLRTGRILGVEALARWNDPVRGEVPPDVFIPIAESSGQIGDVGAFILNTACAQVRRWAEDGLTPLAVAVNVSGKELEQPDMLVDRIAATLEATGLPASSLEIELTESAAVLQRDRALDILERIRSLGVSVAIDDFGTGYSILSRLSDFPADRIKIDRTFINKIGSADDEAPLVAAMIVMGHSLGLGVVAEGVETPDQHLFLALHGCDELQGFLVSRPLEPEDLEDLLRSPARQAELARLAVQYGQELELPA